MRIYMIGICGTGMTALAGLLHSQGHEVAGSDGGCHPPMSRVLDGLGVEVFHGFRAGRVGTWAPDLVIIGNVATRQNPEAVEVLESGIPYRSFPDALRQFCLQGREPIVVTGTHGKTTTSSMMVSVLEAAGEVPGFMIGGVLRGHGTNFRMGKGRWFVIEGDEYDTAFFDKTPKFLHYAPAHGIITSIEFDHADIYKDLSSIEKEFAKFVALIPAQGELVACEEWPSVLKVVGDRSCQLYGFGSKAHWRIAEMEVDAQETRFRLLHQGEEFGEFSIPMPGRHNCLNGAAVAVMAHRLGIPREAISRGLAAAKGAKRRQEIVGEIGGITVMDDFAHHPTAVEETLSALRARYPRRRLVVAFEPCTNTSRRSIFQERYPKAFREADVVLVRQVKHPEKAPEGDRFSSRRLAEDLNAMGIEAHYFPDTDGIIHHLCKYARRGDLVVAMSNGPFDDLCRRLVQGLDEREA